MRSLLLSCWNLAVLSCFAQAPPIAWQQSHGGGGYTRFIGISTTVDGGYVGVGEAFIAVGDVSENFGYSDVWVAKMDALGELEWERSFGGSNSEQGTRIRQTSDGGYIFTGITYSYDGHVSGNHGYGDMWVVKLDGSGALLWQRALGSTSEESGWDLIETTDGGFVMAGTCGSLNNGDVSGAHGSADGWLVKLDADGALLWQRPLGGTGQDGLNGVRELDDGGLLLTGESYSSDGDVAMNHGLGDAWVVRTDIEGEIIWERSVGGSARDGAAALALTEGGGCLVAGSTSSTDGDVSSAPDSLDGWLFQLDDSGELIWERTYGGPGWDYFWSIDRSPEGGAVLSGSTSQEGGDVVGYQGGNDDAWAMKVDDAGELIWQRPLGGSSSDHLYEVRTTGDGGCVLGGMVYSMDGDAIDNGFPNSAWVVKFDADGNVAVPPDPIPDANLCWSPCSSDLLVPLPLNAGAPLVTVHDMSGRAALEQRVTGGRVDCSCLVTGAYLARLQDRGGAVQLRFVKE